MHVGIDESEDVVPKIEAITLIGPPLPLDMEFNPKPITSAFARHGLNLGRCFGSKSGYRQFHPDNIFIPNANVFCRRHGKIWWGDLDLRKDKAALEKVARRLRCCLYVLDEGDGRWGGENLPYKEVLCRALWHTGGATRVRNIRSFLRRSGLTLPQLATIVNVSPARLRRRQRPEVELEIYRRLATFDLAFGEITSELGFRHWGHWWTSPNVKLAGKIPLVVFINGGTLDIGNLFWPGAAFRCLRIVYMLAKRI